MAGSSAVPSVAPSTPGAPSAAVTALNAARASNVAAGKSAYNGTAASLASFTSAAPTFSTAGGTGGGPEAGFNADNTVQNPTISTPALVTSNQSRSNFSSNVTKLNSALTKITPGGTSIVDYLNKSGMPSDYTSRAALAKNNGIQGYTGTAAQNLQLLSVLQKNGGGGNGNTTTTTPTDTTKTTPIAPASGPAVDGTTTTPPATPAGSTANPDGSTTNADGSTTNADGTTKNADGSTTDPSDPTSGLPPALAAEYKSTLAAQDTAITTAQDNLTALKATLTNDPAASAAADAIAAQYATLIIAMQSKNAEILGRAQAGEAAFGGLGVMPQTFMSDEMDAASGRLADLVTKEQDAVLKSNTAYQNDDIKAFNDAQTALEKATNDKATTLSKLLTATSDQVRAVQAQQKADAATKKDALASDVTTSAKIAAGMAAALAESGITDPTQVQAYVQAMATKNGITNTDILQSALVTAQAARQKADLAAANTSSEIQKRGSTGTSSAGSKGGKDGTYSYSSSDLSTYSSLLNTGGTVNGTSFGARGSDGYVDPGAYTAVYNDWIKNGGTPKGFASKFPVKTNVNPSSYASLPAVIRPAAASSGSGYTA